MNNSVFQTMVTFDMYTLRTAFRVAPQNMTGVMTTNYAMLDHWTLPVFSQGRPLVSIAIMGDPGIGKSFMIWVITKTHLPRTVKPITYMSKHAFATKKGIAYYHFAFHEMPANMMQSSADASNGRRTTNDADNERETMLKVDTPHLLSSPP